MDKYFAQNSQNKGSEFMLSVGCSPDKREVFEQICIRFNSFGYQTESGKIIQTRVETLENEDLLKATKRGEFFVITPDSTIWLEQLGVPVLEQYQPDSYRIEEFVIYAVSPLVFALNPATARRLQYPKRPFGWVNLLSEAKQNPEFRWTHPHIKCTAGLLTAFAEFYVAAGMPEYLGEDFPVNDTVLRNVRDLENSIQQYGPSEQDTISNSIHMDEWRVDALVAQERLVVLQSAKMPSSTRPVICYPSEGAIWLDHPLVLFYHRERHPETVSAYTHLRDYLLSADAQAFLNSVGFRACGPHIRGYISTPNISPALMEITYRQRSAAVFNLPSAEALYRISKSWYPVKRPAVICLVIDISGSMEGPKLAEAKQGLLAFLDEIASDQDRVGIFAFDHRVTEVAPIDTIGRNRVKLTEAIENLASLGQTAALDAISMAYDRLQSNFPNDPIRAAVVLTDGLENASSIDFRTLEQKIENGNKGPNPVAIFGLAYGEDADINMLRKIAALSGASAVEGTLSNIRAMYRQLSMFV